MIDLELFYRAALSVAVASTLFALVATLIAS